MSRSALAVILALVAVAGVALFWPPEPPPVPAPADAPAPVPAAGPAPAPATGTTPPATLAGTGSPDRLAGADDLARFLSARGLDGPALVAGWRAWRLDRGLLGAHPLSGVTADNERARYYSTLDPATLSRLAQGGDAGALQALGIAQLPRGLVEAVEYLGAASRAGSAGAMLEVAELLGALGDAEPADLAGDTDFQDRLNELRGSADRDLREDALAWQLAALRQYGPGVAGPEFLAALRQRAAALTPGAQAGACARSLAILADLSATRDRRSAPGSDLPPAFAAPEDLYANLPCADTAAPVAEPPGLATCRSWPALDAGGRGLRVWAC